MTDEIRRGYKIEIFENFEFKDSSLFNDLSLHQPSMINDLNTTLDNNETLLIDGEIIPFIKNSDGYYIYYQSSKESLLEAAQAFVDTQRGKTK